MLSNCVRHCCACQDKTKRLVTVVGATGVQGGSVVRHLLKDGKFQVRGVTRNSTSEASKALAALGVEVVVADLGHKDQLVKAFAGSWAVFGVTNSWQADNLQSHEMELELKWGYNLVDAAVEAKVEVYVHAALDDIAGATGGKAKAVHFTVKHRALERARKSTIPTVVAYYSGNYASNLEYFGNARVAADGAIEFGWGIVRADVGMPLVDEQDHGLYVVGILNNPSKYSGKIVRSGRYISFPQMAATFQQVTGRKARFFREDEAEFKKTANPHIYDSTHTFSTVGYYLGADLTQDNADFPQAGTFESWLRRTGWTGPKSVKL